MDLDKLAGIVAGIAGNAFDLTQLIRNEDLNVMRAELVALCHEHPVKAAQVIMALTAQVDTDEFAETLRQRMYSDAEAWRQLVKPPRRSDADVPSRQRVPHLLVSGL